MAVGSAGGPIPPPRWREIYADEWPGVQQMLDGILKYPFPLPESFRGRVEVAFYRSHFDDYELGELSNQLKLGEDFRRYALRHAGAQALERIAVSGQTGRKPLGAPGRAQLPGDTRPYRTREEHERNAQVVTFVAERAVEFESLLRGELLPGHRGPQVSVWKALCREWNRAGHDCNSGSTLHTKYRRAISAERPLLSEFVKQVSLECDEEWEKQQCALEQLRQWYWGLTEEERAERFRGPAIQITEEAWRPVQEAQEKYRRARAQLRARFPSEEAFQERKAELDREREEQYRASLTRKDLIAERVRRLVWRLPDEDPEEAKRLIEAPLRDWFLREARGEHVPYHLI